MYNRYMYPTLVKPFISRVKLFLIHVTLFFSIVSRNGHILYGGKGGVARLFCMLVSGKVESAGFDYTPMSCVAHKIKPNINLVVV